MTATLPRLPRLIEWRPDARPAHPSILDQGLEAAFFQFPPRHKTQYFNCAIADWIGARWLVARRRRHATHPGFNDIVLWRLRDLAPREERPIKFIRKWPDEHWEDPRVLIVNNQLYVTYCTFRTWQQFVHQGIARVNTMCQADPAFPSPCYGKNGAHLMANTGWEKNWLWFEHDDALHFVYSTSPHIVIATDPAFQPATVHHTNRFLWYYGIPRGGTPPVYVESDNLYWSFFHSSLDIHKTVAPRRRYYMGAYAFEPWPPFRIKLATRSPLLVGSEADPREPSAPLCVFPCGALLEGDTWLVTLGVNDCACAWVRVPHSRLLRDSFVV